MLEVIIRCKLYIVISKPGSGRVHRVPFSGSGAMAPCDPSSAFFGASGHVILLSWEGLGHPNGLGLQRSSGFMGVTSALVFANLGAASCLAIGPV